MIHVTTLLHDLSSEFPITNLGKLSFFLGIEATYNKDGILLTQSKYVAELLEKTKIQSAKPIKTPMATSKKLSMYLGSMFEDPSLYRSTVGSLQYLSFTRPDLAFAVSKVCQYMHAPRAPHWKAVKRILRYLKNTATLGLQISKSSSMDITAFSDAD